MTDPRALSTAGYPAGSAGVAARWQWCQPFLSFPGGSPAGRALVPLRRLEAVGHGEKTVALPPDDAPGLRVTVSGGAPEAAVYLSCQPDR
ncbi:MAG: hypothetical protein ACPLRU_08715 [Desulfofundulus sp.]